MYNVKQRSNDGQGREDVANDLRKHYGQPCQADCMMIEVFGRKLKFIREGANALLRAALAAYDAPYKVYRIESYNCRQTTSGGSWSAHAWPAAVDINPEKNPFTTNGRLITDMPAEFVDCFKKAGFGWGGDWGRVKDAMHFSLSPSEGGKICRESFDPALQEQANAKWAGQPVPPPPPERPTGVTAPPWPPEAGALENPTYGSPLVRQWQEQMRARGWDISVDGDYGKGSEQVCRAFQREKQLDVDGVLGPHTWRCSWECPKT